MGFEFSVDVAHLRRCLDRLRSYAGDIHLAVAGGRARLIGTNAASEYHIAVGPAAGEGALKLPRHPSAQLKGRAGDVVIQADPSSSKFLAGFNTIDAGTLRYRTGLPVSLFQDHIRMVDSCTKWNAKWQRGLSGQHVATPRLISFRSTGQQVYSQAFNGLTLAMFGSNYKAPAYTFLLPGAVANAALAMAGGVWLEVLDSERLICLKTDTDTLLFSKMKDFKTVALDTFTPQKVQTTITVPDKAKLLAALKIVRDHLWVQKPDLLVPVETTANMMLGYGYVTKRIRQSYWIGGSSPAYFFKTAGDGSGLTVETGYTEDIGKRLWYLAPDKYQALHQARKGPGYHFPVFIDDDNKLWWSHWERNMVRRVCSQDVDAQVTGPAAEFGVNAEILQPFLNKADGPIVIRTEANAGLIDFRGSNEQLRFVLTPGLGR